MTDLDAVTWTRERPTTPGTYWCRFVVGWEFLVTVTPGQAGLIATWPGQAPMAVPVYLQSEFFDRAEWAPYTAMAQSTAAAEAGA